MWPTALPDLNPIDFSVWFLLKANVCSITHPGVNALKTSLINEWDKIP